MSKPTVTITDEDGNELSIPAHFEVCPRCEGEGSHVNPAVDGNGLTAEDFAEDPDFEEGYFEGRYDVTCERCNGARVIAVVDPSRLSPDQQAAYSRYALAQAEYERDYNSERWLRYAESGVMG
jgi:hypothetical protein